MILKAGCLELDHFLCLGPCSSPIFHAQAELLPSQPVTNRKPVSAFTSSCCAYYSSCRGHVSLSSQPAQLHVPSRPLVLAFTSSGHPSPKQLELSAPKGDVCLPFNSCIPCALGASSVTSSQWPLSFQSEGCLFHEASPLPSCSPALFSKLHFLVNPFTYTNMAFFPPSDFNASSLMSLTQRKIN